MEDKGMLVEVMLFNKNINQYLELSGRLENGIGTWDMFFLYVVDIKGETTYYELTGLLPYNASYIIRTIKKLEKIGLIEREKKGKKKVINITSAGKELLEGNEGVRLDFIEMMKEGGITPEELDGFFQTMEKFSRALDEEIEGRGFTGDV